MSDTPDARDLLERAERAAVAGDLASADELLRNAAGIQEAELGPLHPELASTLTNLAIVAEKANRPVDAEAFYRRAAAIASASLPPEHPVVADSRKNLEDFCRERGLPIDAETPLPVPAPVASAPTAAPPPVAQEKRFPPAWIALVALGAIVLAGLLLMRREPVPPEVATPTQSEPQPAPTASAPPQPPVQHSPTKPPTAPESARSVGNTGVAGKRPAARSTGSVSLATAQLCQTLSTESANWKCNPVSNSVSRRRLVLYTRVKSPRDTAVVHRWYRGNTLRQSAKLNVRANAREGYRTYSRFNVDTSGDWRVEVRNAAGDVLYEQRFAVR